MNKIDNLGHRGFGATLAFGGFREGDGRAIAEQSAREQEVVDVVRGRIQALRFHDAMQC